VTAKWQKIETDTFVIINMPLGYQFFFEIKKTQLSESLNEDKSDK
jgi:hypothetical protein